MCLICVEIGKGKLTFKEAWRNFKEMNPDLEKQHKKEVKQKIIDVMVEERRRARESKGGKK